MASLRVKKGDLVEVMSGKYRGKRGKVAQALPRRDMVTVEGVNLMKRHRKPQNQMDPGGIIDVLKPVQASNVMPVCPSCGKPTRIGMKVEGDKKTRYCRRCQATF